MDMNTILLAACAVLLVLVVISLIMNMVNSSKINTLLDFSEDGDLVASLQHYYEKVDDLSGSLSKSVPAALSDRITICEHTFRKSYSKMAIVNFDAFDDVTGKLSFALTLLNELNCGVIITSLYGHNSCNTYVRAVNNGMTSVKLLEEEKLSLANAVNNSKEG